MRKSTFYKPLKQGDVVTTCQDRWAASAACILLPAETITQPGTRLGIDVLRCFNLQGTNVCDLDFTRPRKKDKPDSRARSTLIRWKPVKEIQSIIRQHRSFALLLRSLELY